MSPDGSFIVTVASGGTFGDRVVDHDVVARVSADGAIITMQPIPSPFSTIVIDGANRPAIMMTPKTSLVGGNLVAYDEELQPRWERGLMLAWGVAFAASPSGDVAFHDRDAGLAISDLRVIGADGVEKWSSASASPYAVTFSPTGDLHSLEYRNGRRYWVIYRGDDGSVLSDVEVEVPDGSYFDVAFAADGGILFAHSQGLIRCRADGSVLWRRDYVYSGPTNFAVSDNGDVVANELSQIVRLDGVSGDELAQLETRPDVRVIGADTRGVITLGPIGSHSSGLARFEF